MRSGGVDPGRDGCRVPLPWSGSEHPYGFSSDAAVRLWLDQPADWASLTVEAQSDDPASMLSLYRAGLRLRRSAPWGNDARLRWLPSGEEVLAFARGDGFSCIVNFGPQPVELPHGAEVLIVSEALEGGALPQDSSVWLFQAGNQAPSGAESSRTEHRIGSGQGKGGR